MTAAVIDIIRNIPRGKICTYGLIARAAGNPRAARQVARILHGSSRSENLPWHRVVNRLGTISLPPGRGYELQEKMLLAEGVVFSASGCIDLAKYLWIPTGVV